MPAFGSDPQSVTSIFIDPFTADLVERQIHAVHRFVKINEAGLVHTHF